jgi:hypothetical protein
VRHAVVQVAGDPEPLLRDAAVRFFVAVAEGRTQGVAEEDRRRRPAEEE